MSAPKQTSGRDVCGCEWKLVDGEVTVTRCGTHAAAPVLLGAVSFVLARAQTDTELGYLIGPCTETFEQLCAAEAKATGHSVDDVKRSRGKDQRPPRERQREPAAKLLRKLLTAARSRVAAGHNDNCATQLGLSRPAECSCGHDDLVAACAEASS